MTMSDVVLCRAIMATTVTYRNGGSAQGVKSILLKRDDDFGLWDWTRIEFRLFAPNG